MCLTMCARALYSSMYERCAAAGTSRNRLKNSVLVSAELLMAGAGLQEREVVGEAPTSCASKPLYGPVGCMNRRLSDMLWATTYYDV
jgi:hypothetical protein